jgi:hypothetical protein
MFSPKDALVDGTQILKQTFCRRIFDFDSGRRGKVPAEISRRGSSSGKIAGWSCTSGRIWA